MNRPTLANAITMIAEWLAEHPDYQFCCRISPVTTWNPDGPEPPHWQAHIKQQDFKEIIVATGPTFEEATIKLAQIIVEKP